MLYAKKVIDKNVDHMYLRKISLYGSVLYNKFIDSHLWFIFLYNNIHKDITISVIG
jgi:hypothetical protein